MEEEYIPGKMVVNMMENTNMIKSTVLEYIHGQMEEDMKDNGRMENSMVKENIFFLMVL